MKILYKKLIRLSLAALSLTITGCVTSNNPNDKIANTQSMQIDNNKNEPFLIVKNNADKLLAAHPEWVPTGAQISLSAAEVFYDYSGQIKAYELPLMKNSKAVGSIIGYVDTGQVIRGSHTSSLSAELEDYLHEFLEPVFLNNQLKIIDDRKLLSKDLLPSWALRFKQAPTGSGAEYVKGCALVLENGWFEFRKGLNASCTLVMDSKPEPITTQY